MIKNNTKCDVEEIHGEAVERVRATMPPKKQLEKLANFHRAFADCTRVKILWALSVEKMCVCDLAVLLDMTKSAISHQLSNLREADLVRYEKQGKVVYYMLAECHVKDILTQSYEHINH